MVAAPLTKLLSAKARVLDVSPKSSDSNHKTTISYQIKYLEVSSRYGTIWCVSRSVSTPIVKNARDAKSLDRSNTSRDYMRERVYFVI